MDNKIVAKALVHLASNLIADSSSESKIQKILSKYGKVSIRTNKSDVDQFYVAVEKPKNYTVSKDKTFNLVSVGFMVPLQLTPQYAHTTLLDTVMEISGEKTEIFSFSEKALKSLEEKGGQFGPSINSWIKLVRQVSIARKNAFKELSLSLSSNEVTKALDYVDKNIQKKISFSKPNAEVMYEAKNSKGEITKVSTTVQEVYTDVNISALKRNILKKRLQPIQEYFELYISYDDNLKENVFENGYLPRNFTLDAEEVIKKHNTVFTKGKDTFKEVHIQVQKAAEQLQQWYSDIQNILIKPEE